MNKEIKLLLLLLCFSQAFGRTPTKTDIHYSRTINSRKDPLMAKLAHSITDIQNVQQKKPKKQTQKKVRSNKSSRPHKKVIHKVVISDAFQEQLPINYTNWHPKREFRGIWLATVENIDWPTRGNIDSESQKEELIKILDMQQRNGINAILLQVRPAADAFYAKGQEPWSRFLTGQQGKAPNPFYDPLEFAIKAAHDRGMELHAWFNPYRATVDLIDAHTSIEHITKQNPDWFCTYGGKKLFNPGLPEVQSYIIKVIMNVVRNYDIDGVHFDDYFYPYPETTPFNADEQAFNKYGTDCNSIEDWRRRNVDTLIHRLSDSIHLAKKYVKFGISPFGIWRNLSQDPDGSETNGFDGYSKLYGDARKWVKSGWVDYINPQIYFPFFYKAAAYEKLVDWWANNGFNRHVYIGIGAYRANERKHGWANHRQIPNQIRYFREKEHVAGGVFFSSKSLTNNLAGLSDSLRNDFFRYQALPPTMPWLDNIPPNAPTNLQVNLDNNQTATLNWTAPSPAADNEKAYGYVIYRSEDKQYSHSSSRNILKILLAPSETSYTDATILPNQRYYYMVTALDRLKNESEPSERISIIKSTRNR